MNRRRTVALNYVDVARDLVVALRGRRSQTAFSKLLGYRSNMVHRWESGECWPTAARFLQVCELQRLDVGAAYARMFQRRPDWLDSLKPSSQGAVAAFLTELKGTTPIIELARAASVNRYTLSRWLKAEAHPNLPDFLRVVETVSRRLVDFVACLVDPARLPSLALRWSRLQNARELAYADPWAHAILRVLQLEAYQQGDHGVDWIAGRLGIAAMQVGEALAALERTGQVRRLGPRWVLDEFELIDTSAVRQRALQLKSFWLRVADERLRAEAPGSFGYTLFEVSHQDLERLRKVHLDYVRAMQHIISESQRTDCVGLYCAQLLDLASATNRPEAV